MAEVILSEAEKRYIVNGVKFGVRVDGRDCFDYRHLVLETDVISIANGSAHVRLARTDVLVTVKMELDLPSLDAPNAGKLKFYVNCSATAAPEFEGRGGEDLATTIACLLEHLYASPRIFDKSSLCVVPEKTVKVFYVDVEILECGGNLLDAISIGVKAALYSTKTPKIIITGEDAGDLEFSVSDNPQDVDRVDVSNAPILITYLRITENVTVVDPTPDEECCGPVSLILGVTPSGTITAMQLLGSGTFASSTLISCIKSAKELGVLIHSKLISQLKKEESFVDRKVKGFLQM